MEFYILVQGDVHWVAVGIIPDDTTKIGHRDKWVQYVIAEMTGPLDSQEPVHTDG